MNAGPLSLNGYQQLATQSDRTKGKTKSQQIFALGLFGEAGSLLSAVKKRQRDKSSFVGYKKDVLEEFGDLLWYLSSIAGQANIKLSDIVPYEFAMHDEINFVILQQQEHLQFPEPNPEFEKHLLRLASAVGALCAEEDEKLKDAGFIKSHLKKILHLVLQAADLSQIKLEDAARENLKKTQSRWPENKVYPELFDQDYPEEEQIPRKLTIEILERTVNDKTYVIQKCNDINMGDRLTDNIMTHDDYRFHDAFHYAYAAVLGWSPVIRSLFRLKRKSRPTVDEAEDGARATLIEEGVATYIFGVAKEQDFFENHEPGSMDFTFLKNVHQFVRGYEVDRCPLWLWEEAILQGNEAFRFLKKHRKGRLILDLNARKLTVEALT